MTIHPDDVVRAAEYVTEALAPAIDLDWDVPAGRLEWTVDFTMTHLTAAPAKYALYLSSRSSRFIAVAMEKSPGATKTERVDAIGHVARSLANIAAATPPGVRACHSSGMLDAEGFVALGCLELLVHGYDVMQGLGLALEPPDDLCERMIGRLMPWLVDTGPAWETLLWHTGRIDVPERGPSSDADMWRAVAIPLEEWDGTIPVRDPRRVVGWSRNASGNWEPEFLEG